ncbi:MAG TPA: hypothetical protein VGE02_17620 [Gemmatimonadales bacterium]
MSRRLPLLLALASTPTAAQPAAAQEVVPVVSCDGLTVTAIEIRAEPPGVIGDEAPGWTRPILAFALQYSRSDADAVQPFVLLQAGSECTDERLAESERLLRSQVYLADATVRAVPDPAGGVRLLVETTDDVPLIIGGSLRDGRPASLLYGNSNVLGRGVTVAAEWERGYAYREGFGAHFVHHHAFGGRQVAELHLVRGPLDEDYGAAIARPYVTDVQHVAWRVGYQRVEDYLDFLRTGQDALSLNVEREVYDASMLFRVGGQSRNVLLGFGASHDRSDPAAAGVVVTDSGFVDDPLAPAVGRYTLARSTRVSGTVGVRWLGFRPVDGLATPGGVQDVATGVQLLGTAGYELGDELATGGGSDWLEVREPFVAADLYAGAGWSRGLTALSLSVEGQRATAGDWGDVVAAGRLGWYHRASERRTHVVSAEYAGAWKVRRPFRLTLGSWASGVRGYSGSAATGSRLAVLRLEERWTAGGLGSVAGFGAALFGDVGKLWAGDVPFGYTTDLRASLGAGLLVAVPRRSQSLYRLDLAVPLMRDADAGSWTVRVSRELPYRTIWREPGVLQRVRAARPAAGLVERP